MDTFSQAPPTSTAVAAQPEFATLPDARRLFGISRSALYELEQQHRIRFVRLRKPGNALGRVLVDCDSVRKFLLRCGNQA